MTAAEFRRLALGLPEATESAHMEHPDFRVRNKIFATLGYPAAGWGLVKLTPQQQEQLVKAHPDVFVPANGAWGRQGGTTVQLRSATRSVVRDAIVSAWRNTAPRRLVQEFDGE